MSELPEPAALFRCYESRDIAEVKVKSDMLGNGDSLFTAEQMLEQRRLGRLQGLDHALSELGAIAQDSRDRDERDAIAKCWNAIKALKERE